MLPLNQLPDRMQSALAEQMGAMRLIDRDTLDRVVAEFVAELESVGLAFPGGLEGALSVMDGHISQTAASRLRRKAGVSTKGDPWERLVTLPPDKLIPVIGEESVEVAAVILSKLPVQRPADILGKLPGDRTRRIAFAVSLTGNVDPETVHRIGLAILGQIDSQPPRAFDASLPRACWPCWPRHERTGTTTRTAARTGGHGERGGQDAGHGSVASVRRYDRPCNGRGAGSAQAAMAAGGYRQ